MKRIVPSRDQYDRFREAYTEKRLDELDKELSNEEHDGSSIGDSSGSSGGSQTNESDSSNASDSELSSEKKARRAQRRDYLNQYVAWLWRYWPTALLLIVLSLLAAVLELSLIHI